MRRRAAGRNLRAGRIENRVGARKRGPTSGQLGYHMSEAVLWGHVPVETIGRVLPDSPACRRADMPLPGRLMESSQAGGKIVVTT